MSDSDSFIDEVTEEVRRDRLFGYFRRYGWIAAVVIVVVVGGAGGRQDPAMIRVDDLSQSGSDGLLRNVRRTLRKEHGHTLVLRR